MSLDKLSSFENLSVGICLTHYPPAHLLCHLPFLLPSLFSGFLPAHILFWVCSMGMRCVCRGHIWLKSHTCPVCQVSLSCLLSMSESRTGRNTIWDSQRYKLSVGSCTWPAVCILCEPHSQECGLSLAHGGSIWDQTHSLMPSLANPGLLVSYFPRKCSCPVPPHSASLSAL